MDSTQAPAHTAPGTTTILRLADQLERSFRGGAWHGPALSEVLEGVDAGTAAGHPIPDAHSIWELVGHLSTWLDVCRRRIEGEPCHAVPEAEDWPPAAGTEDDWQRELDTLEERHRRLQETLRRLDDGQLDDPVTGCDPTVRGLLLGILQHHAYHGGQIALLRRAGGSA